MINWTIVAILVNVVIVVGGGVWAIGIINSTGLVLNETIKNLTHTVEKLENALKDIEAKSHDHDLRLTRLEVNHGN